MLGVAASTGESIEDPYWFKGRFREASVHLGINGSTLSCLLTN